MSSFKSYCIIDTNGNYTIPGLLPSFKSATDVARTYIENMQKRSKIKDHDYKVFICNANYIPKYIVHCIDGGTQILPYNEIGSLFEEAYLLAQERYPKFKFIFELGKARNMQEHIASVRNKIASLMSLIDTIPQT